VHALLRDSVPRRRIGGLRYASAVFVGLVILSLMADQSIAGVQSSVRAISFVAMVGLMVGLGMMTWITAKDVQREQAEADAVEEMIQLRRWPEAAVFLQSLLSRPARRVEARVRGLVYLAAVLARFHRFADAITVYDHLLEQGLVDEQTAHGLRIGRAMAMLRDDRLFDADRAIGELRRSAHADESGGLALVEIYRDVKTGHPREAIDMFDARWRVMRDQLGHRVADAYALVARAHDLLGDDEAARGAYEKATLLTPEGELHRRYPEIAGLKGKYWPVPAPPEVA
jgi:hypothetical protein